MMPIRLLKTTMSARGRLPKRGHRGKGKKRVAEKVHRRKFKKDKSPNKNRGNDESKGTKEEPKIVGLYYEIMKQNKGKKKKKRRRKSKNNKKRQSLIGAPKNTPMRKERAKKSQPSIIKFDVNSKRPSTKGKRVSPKLKRVSTKRARTSIKNKKKNAPQKPLTTLEQVVNKTAKKVPI